MFLIAYSVTLMGRIRRTAQPGTADSIFEDLKLTRERGGISFADKADVLGTCALESIRTSAARGGADPISAAIELLRSQLILFCDSYAGSPSLSMRVGVAAIRETQLGTEATDRSLEAIRRAIAGSVDRSIDYVRKYEDIALRKVADQVCIRNAQSQTISPASPTTNSVHETQLFQILPTGEEAPLHASDESESPTPIVGPYRVTDMDNYSLITSDGFVEEDVRARTITPLTALDRVDTYLYGQNHPGVEVDKTSFCILSGGSLERAIRMGTYIVVSIRLDRTLRHGDTQRFRLLRRASGFRGTPQHWTTHSHLTPVDRSIVRVRFRALPQRIWWFHDQPALDVPGRYSESRSLKADLFSYVEHEFLNPPIGPSYGIAWEW